MFARLEKKTLVVGVRKHEVEGASNLRHYYTQSG